MSYHKILVEPAKTARGKCKKCKRTIDKDHLKIQVVDDRKFNDYIEKNGGRSVFHGEGMSRGGYIQAPEGTIAIQRYFVHLNCYIPVHLHPWTKEWFRMERFQTRHKAEFEQWRQERSKRHSVPPREPAQPKASKTKNKPIKKQQTKKKTSRVR